MAEHRITVHPSKPLEVNAADLVIETAQFEPALRAALARKGSTLLHLKLPAKVSTSLATLSAIRAAAQKGSAP